MTETREGTRGQTFRSELYPEKVQSKRGRSGEETIGLTDVQIPSKRVEHLHLGDEKSIRSVFSSFSEKIEVDEVLEAYYEEKYCASRRESIHDRLYQEGQAQAIKRSLLAQRKKQAELYATPPKLNLSTRSYTPLKQREKNGEKAHERLYKMGIQKKKQAIIEEAKMAAYHLNHSPKPKHHDASKVVSRLYAKSQNYQQEGKRIRQQIAQKLNGKVPDQVRSISVSRAQAIYDRGLQFKADREKKIEVMANTPHKSSFPKMRTQTPNRRERFFEAREDDSSCTSARSRSSSVNMARSSSVSRNRRPQTSTSRIRSQPSTSNSTFLPPSRSRERSRTPSRRVSSTSVTIPVTSTTPRLPRSFKLKREVSR
jgi:hypothetical protein